MGFVKARLYAGMFVGLSLCRGTGAFTVQRSGRHAFVAPHALMLQRLDRKNAMVDASLPLKTFDGNTFMLIDHIGPSRPLPPDLQFADDLAALKSTEHVLIQGNALKTWTFETDYLKRVMVSLTTEGRTINTNIKIVQGPDNTPFTMDVSIGKGKLRPFVCWIETPGGQSSLFIRNNGPIEFPVLASVGAELEDDSDPYFDLPMPESLFDESSATVVQGAGSVRSFGFGPGIESVKVGLRTDGRPLNAKIELVQGPNASREVIELYTENGTHRPFFTIVATPGESNMIRVINTSATMEFPMTAFVEPFEINNAFG